MEVGDRITLGAVIVALSIGVTSIVQTKRIQKRQYKQSLLKDIVDWAMHIAYCVAEGGIPDLKNLTGEQASVYKLFDVYLKLKALNEQGVYIEKISQDKILVNGICGAVKDVREGLDKILKELDRLRKELPKGKTLQELNPQIPKEEVLFKKVRILLDKAAEAKTTEK